MPSFMDKVKQAAGGVAEVTKKGAATAQTKAKVHGLRNRADEAAQKLGYLVYRERTVGESAGTDADALVTQIADLEKEIEEAQAPEPSSEAEGSASTAPEAEGDQPGE